MDQIWQCWVVLLLFNLKTGCDSSCGDDGEFYVRDFIVTVILIPGWEAVMIVFFNRYWASNSLQHAPSRVGRVYFFSIKAYHVDNSI